MNGWFDTHIHLVAPEWEHTSSEHYTQAQSAGIGRLLLPGVRTGEWQQLLELARGLPEVYVAPGLHPVYAEQWDMAAAEQLTALTREPKVVAIGEIGLDGVAGPALKQQEVVFRTQLQIALDADLPVLLHSRKTTGRVLEILCELDIGSRIGGIWHGFSGSLQIATELVRLGFKIGVGPILLRGNARKLPDAVKELPFSALVLETDFPDMAEKPDVLLQVAERVAELRGVSLQDVARTTTDTARQLLGV